MKKLSEYKDEEALDVLADLLDPMISILADSELKDAFNSSENKIAVVKIAIKNHKKEVMEILATLEGIPVEEYHCNIFTLPVKCLEILNDKELVDFFNMQAQEMNSENASGSAMVNIKERRK